MATCLQKCSSSFCDFKEVLPSFIIASDMFPFRSIIAANRIIGSNPIISSTMGSKFTLVFNSNQEFKSLNISQSYLLFKFHKTSFFLINFLYIKNNNNPLDNMFDKFRKKKDEFDSPSGTEN